MLVKAKVPAGWIRTGAHENRYLIGTTDETAYTGERCGFIESEAMQSGAFGTLMQGVQAYHYRRQKLTLSAWIKTLDVTGWAGLWLRVDGNKNTHKKPLAFENMFKRPITDTTDWTNYEITLPVAVDAEAIAFGVMLCGAGKVYLDEFKLFCDDLKSDTLPEKTEPGNLDAYINEKAMNLNFEFD